MPSKGSRPSDLRMSIESSGGKWFVYDHAFREVKAGPFESLSDAKAAFAIIKSRARFTTSPRYHAKLGFRVKYPGGQKPHIKKNAAAGSWDFVKTVAERYGIRVTRNRPGDGKTRYSFYKVDAEGKETKHLYTAVGIKEAITYVNAFRDGKENYGRGKAFTFHGSYTSKILAARKERATPGSFIQEKGGRYYVLKPKKVRSASNPSVPVHGAVKIYGRCLRIEAVKMRSHLYGGKKTPATQRYFHDFTTKNAMIYGLPDGSLLIKAQ